jgi:hypothetical protein
MEAQIIAALKKLGHAVSPGVLADHMEVDAGSHGFRLALKAVLDAGTAVAQGKTSGRRIALPGMKFDAPDASAPKPKKHTQGQGRPQEEAPRHRRRTPRRAAPPSASSRPSTPARAW